MALVVALLIVPMAVSAGAVDLVDNNLPVSVTGAGTLTGNDLDTSNGLQAMEGVNFEVLEIPVGGMAIVNVERIPTGPTDPCDAGNLIVNVNTGAPSSGLLTSLDTAFAPRDISAATSPATVSPTQLTFTQCNVTQQLTVTAGSVVNEATIVTFASTGDSIACAVSSTCALVGRFVVVTKAAYPLGVDAPAPVSASMALVELPVETNSNASMLPAAIILALVLAQVSVGLWLRRRRAQPA